MNGIFVWLILAAAVGIGLAVWNYYAVQKRLEALRAWAIGKGLEFSPAHHPDVSSRYSQFGCLTQGDNRYAYNVMRGHWGEHELTAFDYHYQTYSHSKHGRQTHHHHFSAVIVRSPVPLKPLFIRPEHFFDKVTEFFGYDDIDFESAEFSRKFYVKSPDKRWAYDVIHSRMMELLLAAPRFTIQFGPLEMIAYRGARFDVAAFESAIQLLCGMIDRLPDYLVRQQRDEFAGGQPKSENQGNR